MADAFGREVVYTADAGLHQALTRRYADVVSPRGLLCPSDFQSMGFGLPGAIGAALARPSATVVACIGDGALALSLGELLTAVRESSTLVVVVFNDGVVWSDPPPATVELRAVRRDGLHRLRLLGAGGSRWLLLLSAQGD